MRGAFVLLLLLLLTLARAEEAVDHAVLLSASVTAAPPAIRLSWVAGADALGYTVARKAPGAAAWTALASLSASAREYRDTGIAAGAEYEYRVIKNAGHYSGYGYLSAGIALPPVENRGRVILVVDASQAEALAGELAQLQQDLIGDGWTVLRHEVSRSAAVPAVKQTIMADYQAAPTVPTTLFLLGHVPVPYSGQISPDGHDEHVGAWPADVYYGDPTGMWTDTEVNISRSTDARNYNTPGDGKFDQGTLPADVKIQIGRVDMANLPLFAASETELLRQYLQRDHAWRQHAFAATNQSALIDHFGLSAGGAFSSDGFRNFAALTGAAHTQSISRPDDHWFANFTGSIFEWVYVSGPGEYVSVGTADNRIAVTQDFATDANVNDAVFAIMLGSYFGDWDSANNLLRAPLAAKGYGLATMWGFPYWQLHPLGCGHTLGYCAQLTQNDSTLYDSPYAARSIHTALMGDPTLRLRPIAPPTGLQVTLAEGAPHLNWTASTDAVAGYSVYRSAHAEGPYTRLNGAPITGTTFTDAASAAEPYYEVRALRLETTNSGTYWNTSQGALQALEAQTVALSVGVAAATPLGPTAARYDFIRTGTTESDLVIAYTLSGNAVNGTDFESLTGTVTIPAGSGTASVLVVPKGVLPGIGKALRLTIAPSSQYRGGGSGVVTLAGQANALAAWRGTYQGLLASSTLPLGSITLVLAPNGVLTASLRLGSQRYVVTGGVDLSGRFSASVPGQAGMVLSITLAAEDHTLAGELRMNDTPAGSFSAGQVALGLAPPAVRGVWTFTLTGQDATAGVACGYFVIDALGNLRLAGTLTDGTPLSLGTTLSRAGTALLYQALPGGGILLGELTFADLTESDATGTLQWHRAAGDTTLSVTASRYFAPRPGDCLLALANAAGNSRWSARGLSDLVTFSDLNAASALPPNPDGLTFGTIPSIGFVRGQFFTSDSRTSAPFTTVALQKQNRAAGFFRRGTETGTVTLAANQASGDLEVQSVNPRPVVAIAAPAAGARLPSGTTTLSVSGTVSADPALESIRWQYVHGGSVSGFSTLTPARSWSFSLPVEAGDYLLVVKAVTTASRESLLATRAFTVLP